MVTRADPAELEFVEHIAVILEVEGMPRVAGRLFALLLVSSASRSLDDLAADLGVSKGSVSINARLLEHRGLIERISKASDRRDYYQISDDMIERSMEQRVAKLRRFQDA